MPGDKAVGVPRNKSTGSYVVSAQTGATTGKFVAGAEGSPGKIVIQASSKAPQAHTQTPLPDQQTHF